VGSEKLETEKFDKVLREEPRRNFVRGDLPAEEFQDGEELRVLDPESVEYFWLPSSRDLLGARPKTPRV
jgi:hypothetical protein